MLCETCVIPTSIVWTSLCWSVLERETEPDVSTWGINVSHFVQKHLPNEWNVVPLGPTPLTERTVLHPDVVILVPGAVKDIKTGPQTQTNTWHQRYNPCHWGLTGHTPHVKLPLLLGNHKIILRSSSLCFFISTEPLPGSPHRHCCLPVLQWCHRPRLCHHGDLQACTNQAWQVHTGEHLFFLYLSGVWKGQTGHRVDESRCPSHLKFVRFLKMKWYTMNEWASWKICQHSVWQRHSVMWQQLLTAGWKKHSLWHHWCY